MQPKPSTPQDRPISLTDSIMSSAAPNITPRMPWRVVEVQSTDDFQIRVRFVDGTQGSVDMRQLVHSPKAGVFAQLADAQVFKQVGLAFGAVTWPGDIDLAPDAMYHAIKTNGQWVLS
jgi:Protein of unknown function (DUF2442)